MRRDLTTFVARLDLFRLTLDLPGAIADFGVYRCSSLLTWAKLCDMFCPYDRSRQVIGFDSFEGLGELAVDDGGINSQAGKLRGGWKSGLAFAEHVIAASNLDGPNFGAKRVSLVRGRVEDSLPAFLEVNAGLRFCLVHLDMDLYEPTKFVLDSIYDLVVPGGVIVFDEFALPPWEGETKAVESFLSSRSGKSYVIRKHPWALHPHGYIIKE